MSRPRYRMSALPVVFACVESQHPAADEILVDVENQAAEFGTAK